MYGFALRALPSFGLIVCTAKAQACGIALALAVDVSGSVDA
jgi:hypothetical protein